MVKNVGTVLLILFFAILIVSPILTLALQQPTLAVTIRTFSMTPVLTRGDMVFIWPVTAGTKFNHGQIIVYQSPEDGIREWTMHRIVGGDAENGFITKGDANERPDQEGLRYPPVKPEWIHGVVPTILRVPLKIPLLGYLPLLLEENIENPLLIPGFLGILATVLLVDELTKTKKRRKKEAIQKHHFYYIGAAAFAVMMVAVMLMGSLFITFLYGVDKNPGVIMSSDVGVLQTGTSREITLAELANQGMIPSIYMAASSDPQVELEQDSFSLHAGEKMEVKAVVHAREEGMHQASVTVGMFLPFLPVAVIRFLVQKSIWLAFAVTAIVPAIPLFCMPFLDNRFRRKSVRKWRKKISKITAFVR